MANIKTGVTFVTTLAGARSWPEFKFGLVDATVVTGREDVSGW